MTERPIIFSGPMVRAILEGRKTQTRRVVRVQPQSRGFIGHYGGGIPFVRTPVGIRGPITCPYGEPRHFLWVREAWRLWEGVCDPFVPYEPDIITGSLKDMDEGWLRRRPVEYRADAYDVEGPWRPSIHMPRWASRITLEITDVRVERLQQITGADAVAEGVRSRFPDCGIAQNEFHDLWDSINARRGHDWYTNPWVWVIEFRRSGNDT